MFSKVFLMTTALTEKAATDGPGAYDVKLLKIQLQVTELNDVNVVFSLGLPEEEEEAPGLFYPTKKN